MSRLDWECGFDAGVAQRDELRAQRDELLAALTQVRSELRAVGFISGATQFVADTAIAKAQGQAFDEAAELRAQRDELLAVVKNVLSVDREELHDAFDAARAVIEKVEGRE